MINRTFGRTLLASLLLACAVTTTHAQLYITSGGSNGFIGEYSTTGETINASLASMGAPVGIALSGNDLFVVKESSTPGSAAIREYTTAGNAVNTSLFVGLYNPFGLAISGNDLFVADYDNSAVGEFSTSGDSANPFLLTYPNVWGPYGLTVDNGYLYVGGYEKVGKFTLSGQVVNANLINTGITWAEGLAVANGHLFISDFSLGTIGEYTLDGTPINTSLISGLQGPCGIAISGNDLYVANTLGNTIGEYTLSGATINSALISVIKPKYIALADPTTYTPSTAVPLSLATASTPAFIQGSQTLATGTATVDSAYIQQGGALTLYAGNVLTAPNGLNILQGGLLEGSGTIKGNVVNSGTLHVLIGGSISAISGTGSQTTATSTVTNNGTAIFGFGGIGGGSGGGNGGGSSGNSGWAIGGGIANSGIAEFITSGTVGGNYDNTGLSHYFNGLLTIDGTFSQTSTGTSIFDIAGYRQCTDYSFLHVTDSAYLEGTLQVNLLNGFMPALGSKFDIFEADGGITLGSLQMQLPDGFSYGLVDCGNNETILEVTENVPEPGTWALLAGGLGMLTFGRRLRRGLPSSKSL